ncbi:hypothetical protein [Kitasatospora sp. NBC_01539]|uniref:hypothetical protein n=1 Tax=unclassified Kitasatospora TaxID=2633591 RepID=UPI0034DB89BF
MIDQEFTDAASEAVTTLRHCGDPEQDHLLDEIQHPETTFALYALAARPDQPPGGVTLLPVPER